MVLGAQKKEWDFSLAEVLLAARMPKMPRFIKFPIASSVLQHCCFRKFAVRFSAAKSSAILGILKRRSAIREVLPNQGRRKLHHALKELQNSSKTERQVNSKPTLLHACNRRA